MIAAKDSIGRWKPTVINQKMRMARWNYTKGWVEDRSMKWWEKIYYFRKVAMTRQRRRDDK